MATAIALGIFGSVDANRGDALIVVAEADQSETLMQTIESVRNVEGVLAVSLVYHQQDEQGEETP
ncbi:chaperone NapD [Salmonella enterica subsp. enterica serovar Montevideo]|nr:chaperone NapD [Salmonella enterica subsp. enterica serovar Montevideo]